MFLRFIARSLAVVVFVALIVLLFVAPALLSDKSRRTKVVVPHKGMEMGAVPTAVAPERLAECLTRKGAVLYVAWWCNSCLAQEHAFGADSAKLSIVQCSPPDEYSQLPICKKRGIEELPTWIRGDGNVLIGTQPLGKLAAWSGCANTP